MVAFEKVIEILEYVDNDELESVPALKDRTFEDYSAYKGLQKMRKRI